MPRTFRISFTREADAYEKATANTDWYDEAENILMDETELDSDYEDTDALMVDLINLFMQFVNENGFQSVTVTEIKEVPYE